MKKIENSTNLTFTDDKVETTYHDDETVLLTINMSFHQKATIKELKKKILHSVKENELYEDMLKEDDYKLHKSTMFYLMFQNFIEYILEDCEDKEYVQSVVDSMLFTEQTEIVHDLSQRKFDMNENTETSLVEVERIPSNFSMSLCSCCKHPDSTNDKTDFSRDTFINKQESK